MMLSHNIKQALKVGAWSAAMAVVVIGAKILQDRYGGGGEDTFSLAQCWTTKDGTDICRTTAGQTVFSDQYGVRGPY